MNQFYWHREYSQTFEPLFYFCFQIIYCLLQILMWNQFLNQSKTQRKFQNTPVLILGNRHSGKRSLVDSLFDISKTTLHAKRLATHADTNKMRLRGLTPIIDYAYLNVLDLQDPDYRTHSKLQIYMIEDRFNPEVYAQLQKPELLKKSVVIIMLDFTNPWNFLEQLDGWIKFLYQLQKNAGFSIIELQEMAERTKNYYKEFKEPQFDENGKLKQQFGITETEEEKVDLPLPDGVLTNNLRMPFVVCVNKCDLQSSVLRDQSANKILFIMYHLRQYCVKYGGALIYTSIKNNANLNTLYQYVLHRAYKTPLRFKPEAINEQSIFIPLGYDNPTLIEDSVLKMDVSRSYSEVISPPAHRKALKEEIIVEQDAEFFKKYIGMASNAPSSTSISTSLKNDQSDSNSTNKASEVTKFFEKLLRNQNSSQDQQKRSNAENALLRHTTMQAEMSKNGSQIKK